MGYIDEFVMGCYDWWWDSWSALYQPDAGSVNIKATYNGFYDMLRKIMLSSRIRPKLNLI